MPRPPGTGPTRRNVAPAQRAPQAEANGIADRLNGGQREQPAAPGGQARTPRQRDEIDPASLTAELDAIDETIQQKHNVDKTLARFSAVHDEIVEEEKRRRDRKSRFMPWLGADEEMEEALSSNSLPIVRPHRDRTSGDEPPEPPDGGATTASEVAEPPKRHKGALAGKIVAIVLAALVFLTTGVVWGAKTWLDGEIGLVQALDPHSDAIRNVAGQFGDENFLLVGSDTRIDQSKNDNAGSVAVAGGARADTVMVAHIPKDRSRVVVTSFPRDLEVKRPVCERWNPKSGKYASKAAPSAIHVKLNSVYSVGGPKCLTDVIQHLSGLRINHFAMINFDGFKRMVDAVHGVRVCSTVPIVDDKLGTVLAHPGPQVISGTQALNYVRARHVHGDPTSGYGRMQRQQRFLASLLRKVLSKDVLLDPGKLMGFVTAFAHATKGQNLGVDELLTLAQSMQGMHSGEVTFVTVPTTGTANDRGNEVLLPTENRALFDAVINGTPLPGEKGSSPANQAAPSPKSVKPRSVKIQVLNAGNPTTGLAGDTADSLADKGFQVMQAQNARTDVEHTTIRYAADATNKAKALKKAVPSAALKEDPAAEGAVMLLIGPDFEGLGASGKTSSHQQADHATRPLSTVNAGDTSCPKL